MFMYFVKYLFKIHITREATVVWISLIISYLLRVILTSVSSKILITLIELIRWQKSIVKMFVNKRLLFN